jgi:hypothetical protein
VRLRQCLTRLHQRQQHVQTRLQTEAPRLGKLEAQGVAVQTQHTQLTAWLETLLQENARDGAPLPIILRVDAGFSTDNKLTWLIEMGYTVVTKVHSGHTTTRLCRMVASNAGWTAVGGNAEAVTLPPQRLTNCPYAVEVLLVCYHLPRGPRYTTLLYYGDTPPPASLGAWFRLYNARQIMEAGIKEQKGVFTMRRPLVRSRIGLQLQEQLSVFATNFVRWAAEWAKQLVRQATPRLWQALGEVKTLVRVVAHSRPVSYIRRRAVGCSSMPMVRLPIPS